MRFWLLNPSMPIQVDDTLSDPDDGTVGTIHEALTAVYVPPPLSASPAQLVEL
jgi:hypothetical protein